MSRKPGSKGAGGRYSGGPARPHRRTLAAFSVVAVAVVALALGLVIGSEAGERVATKESGTVRIVSGKRLLAAASAQRLRDLPAERRAAWLSHLPRGRRARRGVATVRYRTDAVALRGAFRRALRADGGTIRLPEHPVASSIRLPIVRQALRNNCETAALSMLLVARGVRANQLELQRGLARSGPLDPRVDAGTTTWGDPDRGFVGRPEGGGTSGGYGVYEPPIEALARRRGVEPRRLSRRPARSIYRTLLAGRPVLAWVGLSDGPYKRWRTPAGRQVTGNFGEHTVVLTGIRGGSLSVNDPLVGRRTTWTRGQFELMWRRLGRRALSLS